MIHLRVIHIEKNKQDYIFVMIILFQFETLKGTLCMGLFKNINIAIQIYQFVSCTN